MTKLVCKGKELNMRAFTSIPVDLRVDGTYLKIDFDNHKGQLEINLKDIEKELKNLKPSDNSDFKARKNSPKTDAQKLKELQKPLSKNSIKKIEKMRREIERQSS